jgi:hypothetical protein
MSGPVRLIAAIALAAAAIGAVGCGSNDTTVKISQTDLNELKSQVGQMEIDLNANECRALASQARQFVDAVNGLPASVGVDVKTALRDAGVNIEGLANDPTQCSEPPSQTPSGQSGLTKQTTSSSTATEPPPAPEVSAEPPTPPSDNTGTGNGGGGNAGGGSTGGDTGAGTGGGSTGGGSTGGGTAPGSGGVTP